MTNEQAKKIFLELTKNNKPTTKLNDFFIDYAKIKNDATFLKYVLKLNIFDEKHFDYFIKTFEKKYNVAVGGFRAGKTLLNILCFCLKVENSPKDKKLFLVTGATAPNAGVNLIDGNGLGIKYYFEDKIKLSKFEGQNCYKIQTFNGEKILIIVGGDEVSSHTKIQGFDFEAVICTEIANVHINFIEMFLSRILKSATSKIFADYNPVPKSHPFYIFLHSRILKENYNFERFKIFENYIISKKNLLNEIKIYENINSYDFKRNLLGEDVAQKGVIFETFINNFDKFKIEKNSVQYLNLKKFIKNGFGKLQVGLDFGGNKSYHALVATFIFDDFSSVIILKSEKFLQNDDSLNKIEFDLNNFILNFFEEITEEFREPDYLFCDSASPNHIKSVKNALHNEYETYIKNCTKLEIKERIFLFKEILRKKNIKFILESTKSFQESIQTVIYDSKQSDKWLDDGTSDIDTVDAFFYSFSNYIQKIADFN